MPVPPFAPILDAARTRHGAETEVDRAKLRFGVWVDSTKNVLIRQTGSIRRRSCRQILRPDFSVC